MQLRNKIILFLFWKEEKFIDFHRYPWHIGEDPADPEK